MIYIYHNVKLLRVVDGDTVELKVNAGFKFSYRDHFRLLRTNAPERYSPGGIESKTYLEALLSGGISRLETVKRDKYGRWLVELYVPVDGGEMNVSDAMRLNGFAVAYMDK